MDEHELRVVIAFLDEQIIELELRYTAKNTYPFYHLTQLRNYRRVLRKKLTALESEQEVKD